MFYTSIVESLDSLATIILDFSITYLFWTDLVEVLGTKNAFRLSFNKEHEQELGAVFKYVLMICNPVSCLDRECIVPMFKMKSVIYSNRKSSKYCVCMCWIPNSAGLLVNVQAVAEKYR